MISDKINFKTNKKMLIDKEGHLIMTKGQSIK